MTLTRAIGIRDAATTPLDARLINAAMITENADGSPRPGVLSQTSANLVTALATMNVAVAAAEFATSKGVADGVAIFTNDGVVNVPITAAPASNSRITVIWVKHNDNTTGDANALPIFGTTDGVAAGIPTKPSIPTGALELATLRVYSGTTAANGGANTLTNTYQMTALRYAPVPFRNRVDLELWTTATEGQTVYLLDKKWIGIRLGGFWTVSSGALPYAEASIVGVPSLSGGSWQSIALANPGPTINDVTWGAGASSRFIANVRGRYRMVAAGVVNGASAQGRINVSGANYSEMVSGSLNGVSYPVTSAEFLMNVGDYAEFQIAIPTAQQLYGGRVTLSYVGPLPA